MASRELVRDDERSCRAGGDTPRDYRATGVQRRRSWYGIKKHAKWLLRMRIPHTILRFALRSRPSLKHQLPAPAYVTEVEGHVANVRFVMLRPDRCVVAKELYWGGGRRPKAEDNFALELFARLARESDVMLDVGAYTGIFTLVGTLVNPDITAHAFEIAPHTYEALRENCARNGILDRTTLHHAGVGKPETHVRLPKESFYSTLPDFYSSRLHFDTGVLVPFSALDSLANVLPPRSRVVVKVDVEGTEDEVFRYGQEFLSSFRPDILCEVLPEGANAREVEALLAPHGYRFYVVREADLRASKRLEPDARFRDWFFTTHDAPELCSQRSSGL
jgi:FkbM family methyltransferase